MSTSGNPFHFYTERRLVELTGRRARNVRELAAGIEQVPGASIFYHTHHLFLSHHWEKPVVYNDFALWVAEALREAELGEKLAAIDLRDYTSVRQLREEFLARLRAHLDRACGPERFCPNGDEFHFCKSKSFVMPTGIVAETPGEFFAKLPHVSNISLYFHLLEARLRLERPTNDFSRWLRDWGEEEAARAIEALDPYTSTLDEVKEAIIGLGRACGFLS